MLKTKLLVFLLSLWFVRDFERPVRVIIPRSEKVANVIATAASETELPFWYAERLDVFGAHESNYNTAAIGDIHDGIGRSCGAWQTPCAQTPGFVRCATGDRCRWGWEFRPKPTTGIEQARLAISIFKTARENCSEHPEWRYASGLCRWSRAAELYLDDIREEEMAAVIFDSH